MTNTPIAPASVSRGTVPVGNAPCNPLSEAVDEYLVNRGIEKKKYYAKYLIIAQRVWQDLFWNTLWVTKNVWQPLKKGNPYNYIDLPGDVARLFSVNRQDHCGNIVPLYYNNQLNIISPPTVKKCGCSTCDCSGLCEDVNSFTMTTKLLFTINGVDYFEKTWLKYCPNGDILEYQEIPTKRYNDFIGDGGDYNNDYDDDFNIATGAFGNFSIVTEKFQRKVCQLTAQPCGCPEETPENDQLLLDHCGCFLPVSCHRRRRHCEHFLANPARNIWGEVKLSDCGKKIFFRPTRHFLDGTRIGTPILPEFLLVNYQTNGKTVDAQTLVPDWALLALWTGIDWRSKLFNGKYSLADKTQAKYEFNDAVNKIILFLNAFSLQTLSAVQDAPMRW